MLYLWKRPWFVPLLYWTPIILDNFCPISNVYFWGRWLSKSFWGTLEEVDYLCIFFSQDSDLGMAWKWHWSHFLLHISWKCGMGVTHPSLSYLTFWWLSHRPCYSSCQLRALRVGSMWMVVLVHFLSPGLNPVSGDWGAGIHPLPLLCELPQDLVLSTLLFNIYMRPLGELIHCHGVRC